MPKASPGAESPAPTSTPDANAERVDLKGPPESADPFIGLDENDEFLNALFFGVEGTGKTTAAMFAANLPGEGDVVVISAEAGVRKRALKALGVKIEYIKVWQPPGGVINYANMERLYFQLNARLQEDPGCIKAVSMDSLTEITNKLLENASQYWYDRDQKNDKKHWSDKRDTPEVTEIQDYGLMTSQTRKLMRKFRDLPCHFIATALETEAQGEGEFKAAKKQAAPEMSPKLRTSVLGYVDCALRFTSETLPVGERESETLVTARTKPSMLVRAKDRDGIFPRDLPEPRFDRLVDYFTGEVTAATDDVFELYESTREKAEAYRTERAAKKAAAAKS